MADKFLYHINCAQKPCKIRQLDRFLKFQVVSLIESNFSIRWWYCNSPNRRLNPAV